MNKTKIRIKELVKIREKALKEIEKLQDKCLHEKCYIGYFSWRIGSIFIYKICDTCGEAIRMATKEEMDKFSKSGKDILKLKR